MNISLDNNKIVMKPSTVGNTGEKKVYVGAGINELMITEVRDWNAEEESKSASKIPFIVMTLLQRSTGAVHTERFYMGDQSKDYSISKISHIVSVLCPEINIGTQFTIDTNELSKLLVGKEGRFKICGEVTIAKRTQTEYVRASNFPKVTIYKGEAKGFVERLDQPTKLTWDPKNTNDIKPLRGFNSYSSDQSTTNNSSLFNKVNTQPYMQKVEIEPETVSETKPPFDDDLPF